MYPHPVVLGHASLPGQVFIDCPSSPWPPGQVFIGSPRSDRFWPNYDRLCEEPLAGPLGRSSSAPGTLCGHPVDLQMDPCKYRS